MRNTELEIRILDSVHSKVVNKTTAEFLGPVLSYEVVNQRPGPRGPILKIRRRSLLHKDLFPTGLIPRIKELYGSEIKIYEEDEFEIEQPEALKKLNGILYKNYQAEAIQKAILHRRGVIDAPARSGKTVIAAGIISTVQSTFDCPSLFLVNTKDILYQTKEAFDSYGIPCGLMGDGNKDLDSKNIIATFQTMKEYTDVDYLSRFGIIIVDEAHHASKEGGAYWKILMSSLAPFKIGLTASVPSKEEKRIVMEAILGPVIYKVPQSKAKEMGATVKAKLKFIKAPEVSTFVKKMAYQDAYQKGIIENRSLNRLIVNTAAEYIQEGSTVLILVTRVQHGFHLEKIFNLLFPQYEVPFLCGGLDSGTRTYLDFLKKRLIRYENKGKFPPNMRETIDQEICKIKEIEAKIKARSKNRNKYRHAFIKKEIPCVVATNIWNEGVNIPSLNVIINAGGGKSEIKTIQASSRSLTAAPGKEEGIIVDIFNPLHKSFIEHFGHRISTYCDLGWM